MAGLFDLDPEVLAMLQGGSGGSQGLLGPGAAARQPGPLNGYQRKPDEGFLERVIGSDDPRDPRSAMMAGLSQGLLRGSLADGFALANRGYSETLDRNERRDANRFAMAKETLSLNELVRKQREEAQGRDVLQNYWRQRGAVGGTSGGQSSGFSPQQGGLPLQDGQGMGDAPGREMQPIQGAAAPRANSYDQYRDLGDAYAAKGLGRQAQQMYEMADKNRPKYAPTPQLMRDPRTGDLVQVLISDDGTTRVLPFAAKPDMQLENLGGRTRAIDKNALRGGETFDRTMTPGEVASNRVAQGNLSVAQQRLAMDANAPDYHPDGNGGFYALPKRPTPGAPIIGQPVMGPDGQPLGANAPPKLTEFQGKATTFATRMIDATKTLDKVGGRVSPSRIAQAGYRADIPEWMPGGQIVGAGLTAANQLITPDDAQRYRAAQENWVTANLRQESGAAIGKDEMEKDVRKYFPQPGEGAAVISQKEMTRRKAQEAMVAQAGPGAKLIAGINAKAEEAQQSANGDRQQPASALPALPTANGSNRGKKYRDTQTGKVYQSNGLQWKEVQ